jgi:hypothetical protein
MRTFSEVSLRKLLDSVLAKHKVPICMPLTRDGPLWLTIGCQKKKLTIGCRKKKLRRSICWYAKGFGGDLDRLLVFFFLFLIEYRNPKPREEQ